MLKSIKAKTAPNWAVFCYKSAMKLEDYFTFEKLKS